MGYHGHGRATSRFVPPYLAMNLFGYINMKLSDFFSPTQILSDGYFTQLDEVNTKIKNSLVFCQNLDYLRLVNSNPNISCVITKPELAEQLPKELGAVSSPNPKNDFYLLYNQLFQESVIIPKMEFGRGSECYIHASAYISDKSFLGNNVTVGPNVVVQDYSYIGDNSYIASGVVIGAEGLQFIEHQGRKIRVQHAGGTKIGEDVVILSNSVVAKSLFQEFTYIGNHTQIGILTNVGHGVRIGENCAIAGNCIIAGKAEIGNNVWIGASSSIAQGLKIGNGAQIMMGSVVVDNVNTHQIVSGNFAFSHKNHVYQHIRNKR